MAFGEYAKYYDLLYADKDYAAETAFVREIIRRLAPGARTLLELGCGSARHALDVRCGHFAVSRYQLPDHERCIERHLSVRASGARG